MRLRIFPAASSTTGFFSQRFWSFFTLLWNPGLHSLSWSPVVSPGLSACKCTTTCSVSHCFARSTSRCLAASPLHPSCPSPPFLLVWMNVSTLTPWFSDLHTVRFSGSSGYFLFLNLFLSFFWLCKEAKCIYLCLHLGQKSSEWILEGLVFFKYLIEFTSKTNYSWTFHCLTVFDYWFNFFTCYIGLLLFSIFSRFC